MTPRSRRERDEWRRAGEHAAGLSRARLALRFAIAAANHEAAEGIDALSDGRA